ncbi:MAG: hypothetical protein R2766_02875 [Saprospiraceae bacterium]
MRQSLCESMPTPAISGDLEICDGETTTLTATGGTSYEWNTGATTASINVSPNTTTTYSVTVTVMRTAVKPDECDGNCESIAKSQPSVAI